MYRNVWSIRPTSHFLEHRIPALACFRNGIPLARVMGMSVLYLHGSEMRVLQVEETLRSVDITSNGMQVSVCPQPEVQGALRPKLGSRGHKAEGLCCTMSCTPRTENAALTVHSPEWTVLSGAQELV